jgi:hypothetical protein
MSNILTPTEAAEYVRTDTDNNAVLQLLDPVDAFIKAATGRDWAADNAVHPLAKVAAGMLLVQWYDNPGQVGDGSVLAFGLTNVLTQLEVEGLKYRKYQFYGANQAGGIAIPGALVGDVVQKLVGIYGVSGDQSSKFESMISIEGQIQQTNGSDLSDNIYAVVLKSPVDDVTA